jgi:hypothetical protein
MSDPEFLTAAEYARLRRCSLRTLDRERATGEGCRYVRLGSRILYRRADIDNYVAEHLRGGYASASKKASQPRRCGGLEKSLNTSAVDAT